MPGWRLIPVLMFAFLMAGCASSGGTTAQPQAPTASATGAPLTKVTLYMGYIPNVQFAPFYLAQQKGYYRDEGIDLSFDYGMENDLMQLLATDKAQFAIGSGDQVILGRSQGLPLVYVMNWYRKYPVAVFSLLPLKSPQDLKGKTVGVPGLFGATYIGLRGLLYAAGIDPKDVNLQSIGFTQAESVLAKKVDAAVGYSTNEPLQVKRAGQTPSTIEVSDYINLVANGLVTNEKTIKDNPDLVKRMVRATLRGIRDSVYDTEGAFGAVVQAVPETAKAPDTQKAVLDATTAFWRGNNLGQSDPQAWETSARFMQDAGLIQKPVDPKTAYTNDFVPAEIP
ncbi:MAG: ABC transporter substrate-binding protein [Anaerolineae bacterium]